MTGRAWLGNLLLAFAGGLSVVSVSAVCESAEARRAVEPVEDHRYTPTAATQIPLCCPLGMFGLSSVGVFAASPKIIQDKEAIRPEHNNYDGRNYITE